MKRYTLYRAYSPSGELLYVGCTSNLRQRMASHRSESPWYPLHSSLATFNLGTDAVAAFAAEAAVIRVERPLFNKANNRKVLPRLTYAEWSERGLVRGWEASRVAGVEHLSREAMLRYCEPVARTKSDNGNLFDPEQLRRVRETCQFVPHLHRTAVGLARLVRDQVAAAKRSAA